MRSLSLLSVGLVASLAYGAPAQSNGCAADNAGLKLPPGFCAGVFADSVPAARHIAVAPDGDVFVSLQGRNGGIMSLRDTKHDGHADVRQHFATGFTTSEVRLFDGYLYTEVFTRQRGGEGNAAGGSGASTIAIVRYPLKAGELMPSGGPDTVVEDLPGAPGHTTRNFVITNDGTMYVNIGSPSNSCQEKDRAKENPGKNPCPEVETRAGVWRFDARKSHQRPSASNHLARGIRNAVGMALDPATGRLWTTQHGRDQLGGEESGGSWPNSVHYNAENPAEELMQVNQGDDYGWPYCYYSVDEHHLVLAPEYGGDTKKVGMCAQKKEPVAVFPAHWAPNGLMFYTGSNFPARYKNGVFIAFHGSWNRAPEPQAGFNVVFQPLKGGKADGRYEVFADGFGGAMNSGRGNASGAHRPTGLAVETDGSLLVADDMGGRVYRIVYTGK